MASTAPAASRRSGVLPPSIPKVVPSVTKIEGNSERTTSRRNTSRQSHVITPGSIEVNEKLQNGKRDGSHDQSRERRELAKKSETLVSSNGQIRNSIPKSSQSIPKTIERRESPGAVSSESTIEGSLMPPPRLMRRRSPRRPHSPDQITSSVSSESKSTTEGSLMPPPRLTRRRSPIRLHSPDQTSSNTIDLPSGRLRKELPGSESKRPGESRGQTRQSAPARSPVAETISKPSTSAASNKRRSGVVKEVEKLQVSLYIYDLENIAPSIDQKLISRAFSQY